MASSWIILSTVNVSQFDPFQVKKYESCLQYCKVCEGFKAPRSHHCRKCGRCVLKMDHHCPWINNCVGWGNQAFFVYFLSFAVIGCAHATYILMASLIRGLNRYHYLYHGQYHLATVEFTHVSLVCCILSLGLAIGVVIAVGMLLVFQVLSVCRNKTGIEAWIMEKAKYRREGTGDVFNFPYNLGCWRNVKQVFPQLFSCATVGDGLWWQVNEGSDQFTLTLEQLAQKDEKRMRTKTYTIVKRATGSWCPIWSQGCKVGCQPPFTDEARVPLEPGDVVKVTRWKKHWLFGEKDWPGKKTEEQRNGNGKEDPKGTKKAIVDKGWFPRKCAIELIENDDDDRQYLNKHKPVQHHHHSTTTTTNTTRRKK